MFNKSSSASLQQITTTSTQQNTTGGAEGSYTLAPGSTVNNPSPERVLQPLVSFMAESQRQATEYNRAALEAATAARATESAQAAQVLERNAALTANTVQTLATQRANETGAIESLLVQLGPWVIGAVIVLGLFGKGRRP